MAYFSLPIPPTSSSSLSPPDAVASSSLLWGFEWVRGIPTSFATIAIDLGTHTVVAGVYRGELPTLIIFEEDARYFPSAVAFPPNLPPLIGKDAKDYGINHPTLTVTESKRLMGRKFDDIAADLQKKVGYTIGKAADGYCTIILTDPDTGMQTIYRPETIASMMLKKVKMEAEIQLKTGIQNAIITVPAYFVDSQRQATVRAAELAGLHVIRLVNEPSSASLVYGRFLQPESDVNILVFDIGGGTYDTSIVHVQKDKQGKTDLKVKAVAGINFIGGVDFDNSIVDHVLVNLAIRLDYKDADDLRAKMPPAQLKQIEDRVRVIAERTKINICSRRPAVIDLPQLVPGIDFYQTMGLFEFNMLNTQRYVSIMDEVTKVLDSAGMTAQEIHQVMLVGGSSLIPELQTRITNYFNKQPYTHAQREDVFLGAAMIAAKHDGVEMYQWINLKDAMAFDIGIKNHLHEMDVIVPRYTTLPFERKIPFQTTDKNQASATIMVFEGNNREVKFNKKLGEFTIKNMKTRAGECTPLNVNVEVSEDTGVIRICVEEIWGEKSEVAYFDKNTTQELSEDTKKEISDATKALNSKIEGVYKASDFKNMLQAFCYDFCENLEKAYQENLKKAEEAEVGSELLHRNLYLQRTLIEKFKDHATETVNWISGPLSDRITVEQLEQNRFHLVEHYKATLQIQDWQAPEDSTLLQKALKSKGEAKMEVISSVVKPPKPRLWNRPSSSSSSSMPLLKKIKQEPQEPKEKRIKQEPEDPKKAEEKVEDKKAQAELYDAEDDNEGGGASEDEEDEKGSDIELDIDQDGTDSDSAETVVLPGNNAS